MRLPDNRRSQGCCMRPFLLGLLTSTANAVETYLLLPDRSREGRQRFETETEQEGRGGLCLYLRLFSGLCLYLCLCLFSGRSLTSAEQKRSARSLYRPAAVLR